MAQNEDVEYTVSDHAIEETTPKGADPDQPNKSVLLQISREMAKDIAEQSSFNSIHLPANATPEQKIAAFDEMAIHKGLAAHLEKYKVMIDNKLKELA